MAGGANDRRGIVHRIREARRAYRGPFTGEHARLVVVEAGYVSLSISEQDAFLIFVKEGRRAIPINPSWTDIWDDDPIFRCLRRDLGLSRAELRTRLNQARLASQSSD